MTWTVTISISGGGKLGQEVGEEDEENKLQFIGKKIKDGLGWVVGLIIG